jgi:hypothetical protein
MYLYSKISLDLKSFKSLRKKIIGLFESITKREKTNF